MKSLKMKNFNEAVSPFWPVIDTLSTRVFQAIPGIAMDLRLDHYYRVNYVPVFLQRGRSEVPEKIYGNC